MKRETALITGASSGIGLELAGQFGAHGSDLVLVARRKNRLHEAADEIRRRYGVRCVEFCTDLSDIDAANSVFAFCRSENVDVDVLVNNAGFGANDAFLRLSVDLQVQMLHVNIMALTTLTRLFLPAMVAKKSGGILNVSSTGAFQPGPFMAVYYASKSYVYSFTFALADELKQTGVTVSCLAPGPVNTEFRAVAKMRPPGLLRRLGEKSPEHVARAGYRGFRKGKRLIVPGVMNKVGVFAMRFVSRRMASGMTKSINKINDEIP